MPARIYKEGVTIKRVVYVNSKGELSHNGLSLTVDGTVKLQLSARSVSRFEAFYNTLKPIHVLHQQLELAAPGKIPSGVTEIPFELPLRAKPNKTLYETYHGVFVNVQYTIVVEMKRSFLSKDLQKAVEYSERTKTDEPNPVDFSITPQSLANVKDCQSIPDFLIRGHLDSDKCCITKPFTGTVVVERANAPIRSIDIQLVRVETCGCAEGYSKDATEIQIMLMLHVMLMHFGSSLLECYGALYSQNEFIVDLPTIVPFYFTWSIWTGPGIDMIQCDCHALHCNVILRVRVLQFIYMRV